MFNTISDVFFDPLVAFTEKEIVPAKVWRHFTSRRKKIVDFGGNRNWGKSTLTVTMRMKVRWLGMPVSGPKILLRR